MAPIALLLAAGAALYLLASGKKGGSGGVSESDFKKVKVAGVDQSAWSAQGLGKLLPALDSLAAVPAAGTQGQYVMANLRPLAQGEPSARTFLNTLLMQNPAYTLWIDPQMKTAVILASLPDKSVFPLALVDPTGKVSA